MTERGEATKKRLVDAAARVFAERGYGGATTKEIARAAGVAEGTIYRHFADKRELFAAVFKDRSAADLEAAVKLPSLAGTRTVRENVLFLVKAIEDIEREVVPLLVAAPVSVDAQPIPAQAVPSLAPLVAYLEAEQRIGRVRRDIDARAAAFALFAVPFAAVALGRLPWARTAVSWEDVRAAVEAALDGILPPR
ncbi:MAG: helix-turn-helix domain-containing protein [Anaerosomatales bacterium]|nr:helix-turn-helix domain-containing protein [Anaerosomatales bacterium]